jgi:hypothetical protein
MSLKTVARELATYNSDLVPVQEVTGDNGGTKPADDNTFLWKWNTYDYSETGLLRT